MKKKKRRNEKYVTYRKMIILILIPWQALILPMIALYCIKMWKQIPMNIFLAAYIFGNEIINHVAWKRHYAITK